MRNDHYKVLEVGRKASAEDIQRAYRTLALRYHPDRNAAPDAAARMTAINEAWEVLGDAGRRREYDALLEKPSLHPEFASSILLAARDILLRSGWRVLEDGGKTMVLENLRQKIRVVFLDRVDNAILLGITRQFPESCVVLAIRVEGPIGTSGAVIDLLHSERYGAALPESSDRAGRSPFAVFIAGQP